LQRLVGGLPFFLQLGGALAYRLPEEHGEQESGRDRLVFADPPVSVLQALGHQGQREFMIQRLEGALGVRKQLCEQTQLPETLEAAHRRAGEEQLQHLLEQPGSRHVGQQGRQACDRCLGRRIDTETELRRKTRGAEHANRILAVARLGIAKQAEHAPLEVLDAVGVVDDREIGDVVVEGVDREVAPQGVLLNRPVDIVAQQHPFVGLLDIGGVVLLAGTKGRHFDDLAAELHVGEAKPPADQTTVPKDLLDLLRTRVCRHVEVLRFTPQQQVTHAAANQVRSEPGRLEPVQDLQGIRRDVGARQRMVVAGNDDGSDDSRSTWVTRHDCRHDTRLPAHQQRQAEARSVVRGLDQGVHDFAEVRVGILDGADDVGHATD